MVWFDYNMIVMLYFYDIVIKLLIEIFMKDLEEVKMYSYLVCIIYKVCYERKL